MQLFGVTRVRADAPRQLMDAIKENRKLGCALCGDAAAGLGLASVGAREVRKCASCGLVYLYPQPTHEELAALHSSDEYFEHPYFKKRRGVQAAAEDSYRKVTERLAPYAPFKRLVEVGCSSGELLHYLRKKFGCECVGIDVSETAVKSVAAAEGVSAVAGDVRHVQLEKGSFDAAVMVDVIEHVDAPAEVMRRMAEILAPGGVLYLHTLNVDSLIYKFARKAADVPGVAALAAKLYVDFHPFYFSRATLDRLLRDSGFVVERRFDEEIDTRTLTYPLYIKAGLAGFHLMQSASANKTTQTIVARKAS